MDHDDNTNLFGEETQIGMIILQTLSAFLSFMGSSSIIMMIMRGGKDSLSKIHNRMLVGMSSMDLLNNIALGISVLAVPREVDEFIYGAKGNLRTCTAQGFFVIAGISVPCYNSMLNLYYLAVIRYNTPDHVLEKYEPYGHGYALLAPLFFAIIGASFNVYGPTTNATYCSISNGCITDKDCEEPKKAWVDIMLIGTLVLFTLNLFLIVISMSMIYLYVREQAIAMKKYQTFANQNSLSRNETTGERGTHEETFIQACLYISSYAITFIWVLIDFFSPSIASTTAVVLLTSLFYPLQGFWNWITFVRPRYIIVKKKQKDSSFSQVLRIVLFGGAAATNETAQRNSNAKRESRLRILEESRRHSIANIAEAQISSPRREALNPISDQDIAEAQPLILPRDLSSLVAQDVMDDFHINYNTMFLPTNEHPNFDSPLSIASKGKEKRRASTPDLSFSPNFSTSKEIELHDQDQGRVS